MNPIFIDNNINNNIIDNKNKLSIDESNNKNNCLSCFNKKESKIYPFSEFINNCVYIRIYYYNSYKFLKYYNNKKYYKIIDIEVKDIESFDFEIKDIILEFITNCITKILENNNISKIESISNNLTILVLEKIYEIYKINKKLNTIIE
jgi:hypothetical protein